MKHFRPLHHIVWALTALFSFTLLGCGGCASHEQQGKKPQQKVFWELSPEAQATYAYLLYEQALRQEDEATLLAAVKALRPFAPPVNVYVETAVWLMSRKSPRTQGIIEQGIAAFPANTSLNLLYAEDLQDRGHAAQALEHMQTFTAIHPDNIDAKLELALLLVKNNRFLDAEKILKGITGQKRTALVEYYHARALIGMRKDGEAIRHLQKALKIMPDFVEAMAELAYIHEQRKELREARALYETMLQHNDAGQEVLLRLVALSLRLQQPQKALEFIRRGPDSSAFIAAAASMFIEARQYAQAEPLLQALVGRPDTPQDIFFYLAAIAYEGQKDMDKALEWLEAIQPNTPAYPKATLLRAQLLVDNDKLDAALDVLHEGQRTAPEQRDFWNMEIRLLAGTQRVDAALAQANTAIKQWPNDAELAFLRASLLDESGDKAGAMRAMEAIIGAHPDHYQALNYVGYTLAEQNRDLERALTLLNKAVELSPSSDYILDSLAWAQFRAGKLQEAWDNIRKAVSVGANPDPTIWEHYGDIALALKKKDEARKGYYKALELKPSNAQSLREKLAQL